MRVREREDGYIAAHSFALLFLLSVHIHIHTHTNPHTHTHTHCPSVLRCGFFSYPTHTHTYTHTLSSFGKKLTETFAGSQSPVFPDTAQRTLASLVCVYTQQATASTATHSTTIQRRGNEERARERGKRRKRRERARSLSLFLSLCCEKSADNARFCNSTTTLHGSFSAAALSREEKRERRKECSAFVVLFSGFVLRTIAALDVDLLSDGKPVAREHRAAALSAVFKG